MSGRIERARFCIEQIQTSKKPLPDQVLIWESMAWSLLSIAESLEKITDRQEVRERHAEITAAQGDEYPEGIMPRF